MDTKKRIFYFPPPQAFLNSNSPQNIQITIFVGRAARSAKALLLRVKNRPKEGTLLVGQTEQKGEMENGRGSRYF